MKKICVFIDNKNLYQEIRKTLDSKINIILDYFCSLKSEDIFKEEILQNKIKPLLISENVDFLINNYNIIFSCHSKQIFPKPLVNSKLCINIHPGYNPYNRGCFPHVFSIINGFPAGVTIHIMDEKIDHGDIIIQEKVEIKSYETSLDVYNKVLSKEIELFSKVIDDIIQCNFTPKKPEIEGNYNAYEDFKKLCEIDLNKQVTMREAINYFRALTHPLYKNCFFIDDEGNKVFVSIVLEKENEKI